MMNDACRYNADLQKSYATGVLPGRCEEGVTSVYSKRIPPRGKGKTLKIGTWNVRTLNARGKLENVKEEMEKNELSILGLSEIRWKGIGDFESGEFRIIYSGGMECQRGVGFVLDREASGRVISVEQCSDRLVWIKVRAEPVDMVLIQIYMPTTDHEDEEVEKMYDQLEEILSKVKGTENVIIMGDWNAVVGEGRDGQEIGEFGLGNRNDRGERLMEFCKGNKFVVTNTWFQQEKRRRYTWKKPGDTGRFQIDYILVRQRYRNSVKSSWSYPGADINSDHSLVAMKMNVKLKKIERARKQRKWNMDKFKVKAYAFSKGVEEKVRNMKSGTREKKWANLKESNILSAVTHIGYKKGEAAKKPWITEDMMIKMRERRKHKNDNTEEGKKKYRQLNNELRRETDKAREDWWKRECSELEELDKKGRSDLLYAKVRQLTGKNKVMRRNVAIKDANGNLLTEPNEVRNRWKEYIEVLYDKDGKPKPEEMEVEKEREVQEDFKGPGILQSEIEMAIGNLKNGKAVGADGIPSEFLKALGEKGSSEFSELCKEMYEQGVWPDDFTKVVMIPLQKKANAVDCGDFRTISLISHASKVMLKILTTRVEAKAKEFIGRNQFGFRKGCGTRDAIGVMRVLCERSLEFGNDIYVCFIDFEKAFDRVNWIKMMEVLKQIGVDWRDRRMIYELYTRQEAVIRVEGGESDLGIIERGVRQGCTMPSVPFVVFYICRNDDDRGIRGY